MKIVYVVPGFGNTFYCENCFRDGAFIKELSSRGHDVALAPMYIPVAGAAIDPATPVFFGAVNVYLKEKFSIFRRSPSWLERLFNAPFMLSLASSQSGSTRVRGLEGMTLSVLKGESGNQAKELARLITWLRDVGKPDVVHLSNALLLGLAPAIRAKTKARVVCSLQDEDTWVNEMEPPLDTEAWNIMREQAAHVDAFIAVSRTFGRAMQKKLSIPPSKMHVSYIGVPTKSYRRSALPDTPVIGYLSRLTPSLGLDILVKAFITLKKDPRFARARLRITGGLTGDNKKFVDDLKRTMTRAGVIDDVDIIPDAYRDDPYGFLSSLTVLSVPVPGGEAFGTYMIEAFASGVPVVQPAEGAFPEIIRASGAGVLYAPNSPDALMRALASLLSDRKRHLRLSDAGVRAAKKHFDVAVMAASVERVYRKVR